MVNPTLKIVSDDADNRLPVTCTSMTRFAEDPIQLMRELYQTHGDISAIQDDTYRIYFAFGPQYNQQILSDSQNFHSHFFAIRGGRRSAQRRLTLGLLSMNGEQHKRHRRMVKEPFSRKTIMTYRDGIADIASHMLEKEWSAGQTIDLNAEMTRYMLQVVSGILFGMDIPELALETGEMIDRWVAYNHELGPLAFAPHPELSQKYEEMLDYGDRLEDKIREIVDRRKSSGTLGNDVLSLLIQAHDAEGGISDDELLGHVTLLFAAAHLTTAHTLSWTMFLLAQHPEIMRELDQELTEKLEGRIPQIEDIDNLPVLDRVLKESMRILPASSYSQRVNVTPVDMGPFRIKEGSVLIFSQFMTHHMSSVYHEPERFHPDRWLTLNPPPYSYIPFGGGPRMCIGAPLAMQVLKITLPSILQKFRLQIQDECQIEAKVISTMLNPTIPIWTQLHPRDGKFAARPVSGNIHQLVNLNPDCHIQTKRRAA
jgi:cytochrome P450